MYFSGNIEISYMLDMIDLGNSTFPLYIAIRSNGSELMRNLETLFHARYL